MARIPSNLSTNSDTNANTDTSIDKSPDITVIFDLFAIKTAMYSNDSKSQVSAIWTGVVVALPKVVAPSAS